MESDSPIKSIFSKNNLMPLLLIMLTILLSTSIIYCKHQVRRINTVIGLVEKEIQTAEEEYRLMQVEESTYLNKFSPEYLRQELGMISDDENRVLKLK